MDECGPFRRKMEKFMILIQEKSLFGMEAKKNGIWVINQEENIKTHTKTIWLGKYQKKNF